MYSVAQMINYIKIIEYYAGIPNSLYQSSTVCFAIAVWTGSWWFTAERVAPAGRLLGKAYQLDYPI